MMSVRFGIVPCGVLALCVSSFLFLEGASSVYGQGQSAVMATQARLASPGGSPNLPVPGAMVPPPGQQGVPNLPINMTPPPIVVPPRSPNFDPEKIPENERAIYEAAPPPLQRLMEESFEETGSINNYSPVDAKRAMKMAGYSSQDIPGQQANNPFDMGMPGMDPTAGIPVVEEEPVVLQTVTVPDFVYKEHTAPVTSLWLSDDSIICLSASVDKTARAWFTQDTILPELYRGSEEYGDMYGDYNTQYDEYGQSYGNGQNGDYGYGNNGTGYDSYNGEREKNASTSMYRSKKDAEVSQDETEDDAATGTFGVRDKNPSSDKNSRGTRRLTSSSTNNDDEADGAQPKQKKKVRGLRRAGQKFRLFGDDPSETDPYKENRGHKQGVTSAFCDPYGEVVFTASYDGTIRRWDAIKGEPKKRYTGAPDRIWSAKLDTTIQFLGAACNDGCVYIWDAITAQKFCRISTGQTRVYDIAFSPAEPSVVATAGMDGKIKLFDCADTYYAYIDKKMAAKENKEIFVDDKSEISEELCEFEGHKDKVYSVRFSPDGTYVLSASRDKTARLWDARTQTEICRFTGHTGAVRRAEFIAANYVMTASDDGTVRVWKLPSSIVISPPASAGYNAYNVGNNDDMGMGGADAMKMALANNPAAQMNPMMAPGAKQAAMMPNGPAGPGIPGNQMMAPVLPPNPMMPNAPNAANAGTKGMGISVSGLAPTDANVPTDADVENMFGGNADAAPGEEGAESPLPKQELLSGKEAFRFVLNSPVFSIAVSPQLIAAGCQSGEVFLWYADASPLAGQLWSTDEHLADTGSYGGQNGQMPNGMDGDNMRNMQNMPNDMQNLPAGPMGNMPNGLNMPGNQMNGMPNNMRGNMPGNMPGNRMNNMPGNMPGNMPNNRMNNMPGNMPGNLPNGPQGIPGVQ